MGSSVAELTAWLNYDLQFVEFRCSLQCGYGCLKRDFVDGSRFLVPYFARDERDGRRAYVVLAPGCPVRQITAVYKHFLVALVQLERPNESICGSQWSPKGPRYAPTSFQTSVHVLILQF